MDHVTVLFVFETRCCLSFSAAKIKVVENQKKRKTRPSCLVSLPFFTGAKNKKKHALFMMTVAGDGGRRSPVALRRPREVRKNKKNMHCLVIIAISYYHWHMSCSTMSHRKRMENASPSKTLHDWWRWLVVAAEPRSSSSPTRGAKKNMAYVW